MVALRYVAILKIFCVKVTLSLRPPTLSELSPLASSSTLCASFFLILLCITLT